ncbi:uncharacterized protein LOC126964963 [Leptidea sinapis]|uniref:uncharacterized protein LOC126964963 n=1 Tax=Leptidea sinapis TaxID=189913 RepID=UPI0021C347B5|nr:uncharacterized protein LOC126964963 [Leptidea sinapis]
MANNKVNYNKTKGRDEKIRVAKGSAFNSEDTDEADCSILRKPIKTSVTGFAQARKIFDFATEELKQLLSNECDLLYECKVCRNIFRSLVNLISHKRIYCKEKFNDVKHGHFLNNTLTANEVSKIKALEIAYQQSLKDNMKIEDIDNNERIPLTKDLSSVVENIVTSRGIKDSDLESQQVVLQNIPKTSVAVYQNVLYNCDKNDDMKTQVKEIESLLTKDSAVLQKDGTFKVEQSNFDPDNVIQISDEDDASGDLELKCKKCDQKFSTQKTLKSHMKTKHVETRLVYPCPDCLEIFSTSWSVYRHLFKIHRKTAAQIRRMRESIQAKAFRRNNPPAFYEKRKGNAKTGPPQKISEEDRMDQENQAWMDNMEGDGELPRCGGCGRTFERRAALVAHTNTCQPRSRALARRPQETKKIEIQIRKDYNKEPTYLTLQAKSQDDISNEGKENTNEGSPAKNLPQQEKIQKSHGSTLTEAIMSIVGVNSKDEDENEMSEYRDQNACIEKLEPLYKLPYSHQAEKSNFDMLKQKLLQDADILQLICKKCDCKFQEITQLFDHIAIHYKWMRYACKLCNFKHYEFEKVPEHVKIVHKLKGDNDFYCSTVKAINGLEATELVESNEDQNDINDTSPNSRRLSRCSSDSSKLSDDSSSSTSRLDNVGSRKRKMNTFRNTSKKKKEIEFKNEEKDGDTSVQKEIPLSEIESSSNSRGFEENSSDIDDSDEKTPKTPVKDCKPINTRPVRKRTKPVNNDFLYDLSTLLKKEVQSQRDSLVMNSVKTAATKKKSQDFLNNFKTLNKDCLGALYTLSKKSCDCSKAHMKTEFPRALKSEKEQRISNIFVRPMLPKITRSDKVSPAKLDPENRTKKDTILTTTQPETQPTDDTNENPKTSKPCQSESDPSDDKPVPLKPCDNTVEIHIKNNTLESKQENSSSSIKKNVRLPIAVPIKLNKSLDLIRNPLIKKNISDFDKAGMKTKIVVIKQINRKDGTKTINAPLTLQTIKLKKDPKLLTANEEKSEKVVVVQVPKVDCVLPRPGLPIQNNENDNLSDKVIPTVFNSQIIRTSPDTEKICENHELHKSNIDQINESSTDVNDTKLPLEEVCVNEETVSSNTENLVTPNVDITSDQNSV